MPVSTLVLASLIRRLVELQPTVTVPVVGHVGLGLRGNKDAERLSLTKVSTVRKLWRTRDGDRRTSYGS